MLTYIKSYIDNYKSRLKEGPSMLKSMVKELAGELGRLDAQDFEPAVQAEFMFARAEIKRLAEDNFAATLFDDAVKQLRPLLDRYLGETSKGMSRQFPFITDPDLKRIIERDYAELLLKTFPSEAWKSTVILSGSIMEAILFDVLNHPKVIAKTNTSPKAPVIKGAKVPISSGDWRLEKLIDVAVDLNILPPDREKSIDQILRDYRNFVHPRKEIRAKHECGKAQGFLAVGALESVCDHLETFKP